MENSKVFLQSKLTAYRMGLHHAKEKGDMQAARKWLEGIVEVKKEISQLGTKF